MSASSACSTALLAALLTGGCGGTAPLVATGFEGGGGLEDVPDRRTGGSVDPVPTFRVTGEREISFTVLVRNETSDEVRLGAVERDEDGDDQQFVPAGFEPLTIRPGQTRRVTVRGRAVCEERFGGQITAKNGQTFVFEDGGSQNVDFPGLVEFDPCR